MQIARQNEPQGNKFGSTCKKHPPITMYTWIWSVRWPTSGCSRRANPHLFTSEWIGHWLGTDSTLIDAHPPPIYDRAAWQKLGRMTDVAVQLPIPTYLQIHID